MSLKRLVYVSKVGRQVRLEDADAIAQASAARNERADITGLLLYSPEVFIQVLEGAPAAVDATFERIGRDPRHSDVRKLSEESVDARRFGKWSMGFAFLGEIQQSSAGRPVDEWDAATAMQVLERGLLG